jgi:hypothetical protein
MNDVYPHEADVVKEVHGDLPPLGKQLIEVGFGKFRFEGPVTERAYFVEVR